MRQVHVRLIAVAGVLAVVVGVAAAFMVGRDTTAPAQPAAASPAADNATVDNATEPDATGKPAPTPKGDTNPKGDTAPNADPTPDVDPREQAARKAAVSFMRELGMRDPVAATYRSVGLETVQVGIHPRAGEGGRRLDKVTTLVQLHLYANRWTPMWARAINQIEVDTPLAHSRISSPVTVSGLSATYEGTLHVVVTEDRRGTDRVLGRGLVNGGADQLAPFRGAISFTRPTPGIDAGWVIFTGDTGADTGIMSATAFPVFFVNSDHKPQILGVTTNPPATGSARLVTLTGSGTLTVQVKAFGASEVRVLLVPSGTGGRPHAKLLGVDSTSEDGERWAVAWRYPDQSFHGHLLIQVNGRGGTTEHDGIAVVHA